MYYDVVVSIYDDDKSNIRNDSYLLSGGFKTEDEAKCEAEKYINDKDFNEYKYCYSIEEYPCVEIEEHNEDGTITSVIVVD